MKRGLDPADNQREHTGEDSPDFTGMEPNRYSVRLRTSSWVRTISRENPPKKNLSHSV
jgi:hypothetical protein